MIQKLNLNEVPVVCFETSSFSKQQSHGGHHSFTQQMLPQTLAYDWEGTRGGVGSSRCRLSHRGPLATGERHIVSQAIVVTSALSGHRDQPPQALTIMLGPERRWKVEVPSWLEDGTERGQGLIGRVKDLRGP